MPRPELITDNVPSSFFFLFVYAGSSWNTWSGEHYEAIVGAERNERHYRLITAGSARSHTSWTQPIFLVVLATSMACGSHGFIKGRIFLMAVSVVQSIRFTTTYCMAVCPFMIYYTLSFKSSSNKLRKE